MCELFAMSSSKPTAVTFSVRELSRHGGLTADNADGWGLAYLEEGDARVFRDIDAAAESPYLRFVAAREFSSEIVISHIRRATQGEVALRNTQPFARELGGRIHLFAHNGDLHGLDEQPKLELARHLPIGETDSERAFCALLGRLSHLWSRPGTVPDLDERTRVVSDFAREIRCLGPANFAYTDGDAVFLHAHRRKHPTDGVIRPPGLHLLCRSYKAGDSSVQMPGLTVAATQHAVLAASVPLTDEEWVPLDEGEVVVLRRGLMVQPYAGRSGSDRSSPH
jgi:glutamine amidotransferase